MALMNLKLICRSVLEGATMKFLLIFCMVQCSFANLKSKKKPNVVVIMADDLGLNDVSFRGSNEIPTPNIDSLAYHGAVLNKFYTPPLCTPSRSSLMTGKYPHHIGMQHYVIPSEEPWALGKDDKILPQYFKEAGYRTTLVGKWHLGFYQKQYTPTERGFDSFFGYLGPYIDYYDYTLKNFQSNISRGFDMRSNLKVANDFEPIYATTLFTNKAVETISTHDKNEPMFLLLNHLAPHTGNDDFPMQAPAETIAKFSYIEDLTRRTLAAMIFELDSGVGQVVKALSDNKMLDNTIIVFYSDNGGPTIGIHSTAASNYPLRGQKQSGWEGGTRTNAIFYSPFMKETGVVRNHLMHVADLLPTLMSLVGVKLSSRTKIDGVDQTNPINRGWPSTRNEIVNVDNVLGFGSRIANNYKFVNGSSSAGKFDGYLACKTTKGDNDSSNYVKKIMNSEVTQSIQNIQKRSQRLTADKIFEVRKRSTVQCQNSVNKNPCDLKKEACLFDLSEDPCEENNLAHTVGYVAIFHFMKRRYEEIVRTVVASRRRPIDYACDPINFNNTWTWWQPDS